MKLHLVALLSLLVVLAACSSKEDRAKKFLERGLEFAEQEKWPKAKIELQNAVQNDPNLAEAYRKLADIYEIERDLRKFYENLFLADRFDSTHVSTKKKLIEVLLLTTNYEDALTKINELAELAPSDPEVVKMRSAALIGSGDTETALNILEAEVQKNPTSSNMLALQAAAYESLGEIQTALGILDTAIKHSPEDDLLRYKLLRLNLVQKLRDITLVEETLKDIVSLDAEDFTYTVSLARLYQQTGRALEAESLLSAYSANHSDNEQAKIIYIQSVSARDQSRAQAILDKEIAANPTQTSLVFYKAQSLIAAEQFEDAIALLQETEKNETLEKDQRLNVRALIAELFIAREDYAAANELLEKNLLINESHEPTLMVQAKDLARQESFPEAIGKLRTVLRTNPDSEQALVMLARTQNANGSDLLADDAYRQVLDINPYNAEAAAPVARRMIATGDIERADQVITTVLSRNPNNNSIKTMLAQIKVLRRDWASSTNLVDDLQQDTESSAYLDFLSGRIFQGQGQYTNAIEKYKSSLSAQSQGNPALQALAAAELLNNNADELYRYLESFQQSNPDYLPAYAITGSVHREQNKPANAIEEFRKGLDVNPDWEAGYTQISAVEMARENRAGAIAVLEEGIAQIPESIRISLSLALLYDQEGRLEDVLNTYETIIAKHPENPVIINNYVLALVDRVESDEAIAKANQLVEKIANREEAGFLDTVGWVRYKAGEFANAETYLRRAAEGANRVPIIQYHFGLVLKALNRTEEAKQVFNRAKRIENITDETVSLINDAMADI